MTTAEVGIIGAGVHGASVAFHLASKGVKTLLIDKRAPAGGPTGRSSAVCRAYYTNPFLAEVARESLIFFREFESRTGGRDAGFHKTGFLWLHPHSDVDRLGVMTEHLNQIGTSVKLVSVERLHNEFPGFDTGDVGGAVWEDEAGYADPVLTTQGLVEAAVDSGLGTRFHNGVARVAARRGSGALLTLESGEQVECKDLLIAAGPWSKPLAAQLGIDLPLSVQRHIVATIRWKNADFSFGHADIIGGYYCRPEGEDLYLLGPLDSAPEANPDDFLQSVSLDECAPLLTALSARVPASASATLTGGWASLYDMSPDWQPVIGEIARGVYVDAGSSGHGFKLAPVLGGHVAAMIMGNVVRGLRDFDPERFRIGRAVPAGFGDAKILG